MYECNLKQFSVVFMLLFSFLSFGQIDLEWATQLKQDLPSGGEIHINSTAIDANDNMFVVGYFEGAADFDPYFNSTILTSNGLKDIFLAKYNSSGQLQFAHSFGSVSNDECDGIEVDVNGNLYLFGTFSGPIDFDPGTATLMTEPYTSQNDFIVKYDSSLNCVWSRVIGSITSSGYIDDMDVSASGEVYITGKYGGDSLDIDPSSISEYWLYTPTSFWTYCAFFAKYDTNGNFVWADQMTGSYHDPFDLELDQFDNVLVTGRFQDSIKFTDLSSTYFQSQGFDDIYVVKYTNTGVFQWANVLGGTSFEEAHGLAIDNSNNILVTGRFFGTINLSSGPIPSIHVSTGNYDVFLAKYSPNGSLIQAESFGGASSDEGHVLTTDASNNVYLSGIFSNSMTVTGGTSTTLTSNGDEDIFCIKTDSLLQVLSAYSLGGDEDDLIADIEVTSTGNFRLVGSFLEIVDFDLSSGVTELVTPNFNVYNSFISENLPSDSLSWLCHLGAVTNTNFADNSSSIAVDEFGNSYVVGDFSGSIDFDGAGPLQPIYANGQLTNSPMGFLAKFDATGNHIWSIPFLSDINSEARSVVIDNNGNVLVTGRFRGTVDFDNSPLNATLTAFNTDMFIAKYTSNGAHVWSKNVGQVSSLVDPFSITSDAQGNVIVSGSFANQNTAIDFDPNSGLFELFANYNSAFILKLTANGGFVFAKQYGDYLAKANCVRTDVNNNIYVGGEFDGTINFSSSPSNEMFSSQSSVDAFLAKLDPNGDHIFSRRIGGSSSDAVNSIAIDSEGRIAVTGLIISSNAYFDVNHPLISSAGGFDAFLAQYESNGDFRWVFGIGNTQTDEGLGLDIDVNDNIYLCGYYTGTVYPNPSDISIELTNTGIGNKLNGLISKYDANGNYISSTKIDGYDNCVVRDLVVRNTDIYVAGDFWQAVDIDNTSNVNILTASSGSDVLMAKYSQLCNNSSSTYEVTVCGSYFDSVSGTTFDSTGVYLTDIGTNSMGCDSLISVDLTIHPEPTVYLNEFDCSSFTLPSTGVEYTTSGQFTIVLQSNEGCDSTILLDLIIGETPVQTEVVESCGEYTWSQNNQTYYTSGVHTETFTNQYGCDSSFVLDLTVSTVNLYIQSNSSQLWVPDVSTTYQWLDCDNNYAPIFGATQHEFAPTSNGSYAALVTNQNCTDTTVCVEMTSITIGLEELSESIGIHPNPTKDNIHIQFPSSMNDVKITVYDASSRRIYVQEYFNPAGGVDLFLEGESGLYFIEFESNGTKITKRVVKTTVSQ